MDAASTDAAAFSAFRAATVRRFAADPVFAGLAESPDRPTVFRPWLDPLPRVAHALERLLTTALLPAPDRAAHVRAALEETAAPGAPDPTTRAPAARYVWDLARREDSLWSAPPGERELFPVVTDWSRLTKDPA